MPKQKRNIDYLMLMLEQDGVLPNGEDNAFIKDLLMESGEVDRLFELYSKNLN